MKDGELRSATHTARTDRGVIYCSCSSLRPPYLYPAFPRLQSSRSSQQSDSAPFHPMMDRSKRYTSHRNQSNDV